MKCSYSRVLSEFGILIGYYDYDTVRFQTEATPALEANLYYAITGIAQDPNDARALQVVERYMHCSTRFIFENRK